MIMRTFIFFLMKNTKGFLEKMHLKSEVRMFFNIYNCRSTTQIGNGL